MFLRDAMRFPPGTKIEASDRIYIVANDFSWRVLEYKANHSSMRNKK
jgi:hypothetical protein